MPDDLDIGVVADGNTVRLRVAGDVDMATAPQVLTAIRDAGGSGADAVVVDLSGVTFMDSTGISALVLARRQLADTRIGFSVVDVPQRVAATMRVAGVIEHLLSGSETTASG